MAGAVQSIKGLLLLEESERGAVSQGRRGVIVALLLYRSGFFSERQFNMNGV